MFGLYIEPSGRSTGRRWFNRPAWRTLGLTSHWYGLWCPEELAFLTAYRDGYKGRLPRG